MRKTLIMCAATAALLAAGSAGAQVVQNGGFETNGGTSQVGDTSSIANWTVPLPAANNYVFVFNAGGGGASGTTADTTGGNGVDGLVKLWGPGTGSANGLTLSPNGGAFVADDGDFTPSGTNLGGPITQTITGLTKGQTYQITFDWAAAQQSPFMGATSSGWIVDLGGAPTQSVSASIGNEGFSGWKVANLDFTADGTSDVLSFLATGVGGAGEPPFALLDGVSITPVPEPATWALMLVGVGALGAGLRMRRREAFAAA